MNKGSQQGGALQWRLRRFDELSPRELYDLLQLRSEVFVVEQQCIFLDMDGKDLQCLHLLGYEGPLLAAYTRLVPPGVSYPVEPSIGRVVTSPAVRGRGYGRLLMLESIDRAYELFGRVPLRIGAQCYLLGFYGSLGFVPDGGVYLEDGIEHQEMLLPVEN